MTIQEIKTYMKKQKITYQVLSDLSGVPITTIKDIFRGATVNPRIDTMNAIVTALGLDNNETMSIPKNLENVPIAFSGKLEQLTQEDMEDVSNYIDFIIAKKKR